MGKLSFQEEVMDNYKGGFRLNGVSLAGPRRSFHRGPSSLAFVTSRLSFSYDRLSQLPIHLTVIKLDGSSFEISITKSATISNLKQAVERVFSHLSTKGLDEISWRHIWGHFCLSFGGVKLLNDSENIKDYGIKDGDELRFMRHVSIAYKKQTRNPLYVFRPCKIPETSKEERQELEENEDNHENSKCQQYKDKNFQGESDAIQRRQKPNQTRVGFVGYFKGLFHFVKTNPLAIHPKYPNKKVEKASIEVVGLLL